MDVVTSKRAGLQVEQPATGSSQSSSSPEREKSPEDIEKGRFFFPPENFLIFVR